MDALLSKQDISNIPKELCPMMVFSYGIGDAISTAIAIKEGGFYNHYMWLYRPGYFASQAMTFREIPVEEYLKKHALKFVYNQIWQVEDRAKLRHAIRMDLDKSWFQRLYDPLAIIGQLLNMEWIQIPGADICSDKGAYLKLVDKNYNLKHPSPTDINKWSKEQPGYTVYGRYRLD